MSDRTDEEQEALEALADPAVHEMLEEGGAGWLRYGDDEGYDYGLAENAECGYDEEFFEWEDTGPWLPADPTEILEVAKRIVNGRWPGGFVTVGFECGTVWVAYCQVVRDTDGVEADVKRWEPEAPTARLAALHLLTAILETP